MTVAVPVPVQVPSHYSEHFRLYDPIGGEHMNIMKAALLTAHRLVAVSHGCVPQPSCMTRSASTWHVALQPEVAAQGRLEACRWLACGARHSRPA